MGYATLTVTLLLLIQYGEGVVLTIQSTSNGNVLTGKNISLDLTYNIQLPSSTFISWTVNGSTVVTWFNGTAYPSASYANRLWIIGIGSLLISNATKDDPGTYVITVSAPGEQQATRSFQVNIYDAVVNATVTGSPQEVDEKTAVVVKVTCNASGDVELVTWTKDGKALAYNDTYSLQDGNRTLQIKYPNRTHAGNYTCTLSNPVSFDDAIWELKVSYPVLNVKVTQSPQEVREGAAFVNLSCSASSGYIEAVAWMKDGQSVVSKNSYSLLDGNQTLQITQPNRTFSGIYTCNMSNAAYRGYGSRTLTVSYATLQATSTLATTITSLLAGILLAH